MPTTFNCLLTLYSNNSPPRCVHSLSLSVSYFHKVIFIQIERNCRRSRRRLLSCLVNTQLPQLPRLRPRPASFAPTQPEAKGYAAQICHLPLSPGIWRFMFTFSHFIRLLFLCEWESTANIKCCVKNAWKANDWHERKKIDLGKCFPNVRFDNIICTSHWAASIIQSIIYYAQCA